MAKANLLAMLLLAATVSAGSVAAQQPKETIPAPETKGGSGNGAVEGWKPSEKPAAAKSPADTKKPEAEDAKKPGEPASPPPAAVPPSTKAAEKPAAPAPAATPPAAIPPPEVLLMLVRTTLVALNHANFTSNYSVLHGLGSPGLQAKNTPQGMSNAFANMRQQGIDLSPTMVLTPQLTQGPELLSGGALKFGGFFPSNPHQIKFAMVFMPVDGRWRIDALSVDAVRFAEAGGSISSPAPAATAK